jgi:hypothetical protein
MRAELDLITAGFDKLPALSSGVADQLVAINSSGTGLTTITTLPTLTVNDSAFTVQDNADNTRKFKFEASGITAGATRTFTMPDATTTLVGTDTTQTLTNKTLTSPTISSPTITGTISAANLTLTGNTTLGDTTADSVTINGLLSSNLLFVDNTYDIGAVGATRPRNLYLSGSATVNGNVTLGDASSDTVTVNGTITSNLIFTDNTYDIGASGATRPRNLFLAGNATVAGNTTIGDADTDTITQAASYVTGTQLKSAKTATNTLSLAAYDVDGTAYTNLITLTASNTPTLALTSTGVGTINNMSIGATTASTGAFTTLSATGSVTLGDASADAITVNGTVTSNLIFTDNTYDIGASGATRPRTGYFGTSVISPLVDATNLEVTNLKALDGTAAGSIANSTGVVTLASSVLTTTDINGGTIDGTAIGGASAAAGAFTTLSATGVTTVQAGTAAAPAITTTGDTNTGIFFPAADTIAFSEGGAEAMRIDSSGNVGIGANSPAYKLDMTVTAANNAGMRIYNTTAGTGNGCGISFSVANGFSSTNQHAAIQAISESSGNTTTALGFYTSGGSNVGNATERARIDSSGNLLVGATTARSRLTVGTASASSSAPTLGTASGAALFSNNAGTSEYGLMMGSASTGQGWIQQQRVDGTATAYDLWLQPSGGNVGIGTSSPTVKLQVNGVISSNDTVQATSGTTVNVLSTAGGGEGVVGTSSNHALQFRTNNTERARIDTSGNVGIGVTPSAWSSATKVVQLPSGCAIATIGPGDVVATQNAYFDTPNFKYASTTGVGSSVYRQIDGTHRWSYAASGTAGNNITFTEAMRIDSSGNLLVGTTSSAARITAKAATSDNSGYVTYMDDSAGTLMFYVRNDGVFLTGAKAASPYNNNVGAVRTLMVTSSGVLGYNASTRNTKINIASLTDVNWLFNLEPVSFNYREKDDDNNYTDVAKADVHYGLIAEDAEIVNKDLCFYNEDGSLAGVNYDLLSPALLKAIQELKALVDTQASTITTLTDRITALEAK